MGFTPTQFEKLAINDLEYNKFVLDSNWNVAVRVSSVWGGWSITLQNIVFVSQNWNDTTGLRNRLDKPFLTIWAATAVALDWDTIWVYPGTYNITSTLAISNYNLYLQDATIDLWNNNWPAINFTVTWTRQRSIYGTGIIKWDVPAGTSLIQVNASWWGDAFIFLKQVTVSSFWSPQAPIFSITGRLTAEIYQNTFWLWVGVNGLFQFATSWTSNRFYYKCPSLEIGASTLNSNFDWVAEIIIDNFLWDIVWFNIATGATGTFILKNTAMYVVWDPTSNGIVIETGATPTVILWNTVIYLPTGGGWPNNGSAVRTTDNNSVYFYGVNQSNKWLSSVVEVVWTLTTDTNLIFPRF